METQQCGGFKLKHGTSEPFSYKAYSKIASKKAEDYMMIAHGTRKNCQLLMESGL